MSDIFTLILEGRLSEKDITLENVNSIYCPSEEKVDSEEYFGTNPFLFAVINNKINYLKMLKEKGCDINFIRVSPNNEHFVFTKPTSPIGTPEFYKEAQAEAIEKRIGDNALILAIKYTDNIKMFEYLHTEMKFPLDYVDNEGRTLAHIAICNNASNCMVYVLNNYQDAFDIKDNENHTPEELAKYINCNNCMWAFYRISSARSNSSQSSREGQVEATKAVEIIESTPIEILQRKPDLRLIFDKKKKPFTKPEWGPELKSQVLKKLDDFVNNKDEKGRNILHLAILHKCKDAFIRIMQKNKHLLLEPDDPVKIDEENYQPGQTPLDLLFESVQDKNRDEEFFGTVINFLWEDQNQFDDEIKNKFTDLFEKDKLFGQLLCPGGTAIYSF